MSLLLQGLGVIYERIGKVESGLATIREDIAKINVIPVPIPSPTDPLAAHIASIQTHRQGLTAKVGNPQIHGGINTVKLPNDDEIGRIYGDDNASVKERFVIESATAMREAGTVVYANVNSTILADYEADDHDLFTGFDHETHPASVFSSDSFVLASVPTSGPGAPPSGVFRRYYKLETVVAGNPPEELDSGRLYREWYVNGAGHEVWVDHYVLFPDFAPPDVGEEITLRFIKQTTGIPASTQAFLDEMNDFIEENPGDYDYSNLVLEWEVFDT